MEIGASVSPRVLIVAPLGADGRNIETVLRQAGMETLLCRDLGAAVESLDERAGALVLTEEATISIDCARLRERLREQPPWSDLPIILIVSASEESVAGSDAVRGLGSPHTLTLLERPLRSATLVASLRGALVGRRRQYQVRDLLQERDVLLGSLEAQVADRTAKLRRMLGELESFSYSVSHDLRSPLRVLDGYARALREDYDGKLDSRAQRYLTKISDTAQRMDRLTQDILAYSQVSRLELVLQPVSLDTLMRDVIDQYPSLAAAKEFFHVQPELGAVMGHEPSLFQCISNLLDNALKFASADRPSRIEIRSERTGGRMRIFIEDNGTGIDIAHRERVFGLFEREASKDVPGTGIGLAIVSKAVERMGGRVGVDAGEVHGCIFWIELAAAEAPLTAT